MVSSYPPDRCGVAIYTKKLAYSLSRHLNICIIANKDDSEDFIINRKMKVMRSWKRNTLFYFFEIWKTVLKENPDIIHIQYEYLLYGVRKYAILFPLLLILFKFLKKPIILTMHSVILRDKLTSHFFGMHGVGYRFALIKRAILIIFTKLIGWLTDYIIVHNNLMKLYLVLEYNFAYDKIWVIPHGIDEPKFKLDKNKAKVLMRLNDSKVILFYGFIIPGKGVENLLKAMPIILREIKNVTLIIASGYHPRLSIENPGYLGTIQRVISQTNLNDVVIFENKFISEEILSSYISASDVIVFPYDEDAIIGASGALASCALSKRPVIVTNIPRFNQDIKNNFNGILVDPKNEEQLAEMIILLLKNEELSNFLSENLYVSNVGRKWSQVAERHFTVYKDIVSSHLTNGSPLV
jgi:glycosyltransferase involved in cell wall biosynthesis